MNGVCMEAEIGKSLNRGMKNSMNLRLRSLILMRRWSSSPLPDRYPGDVGVGAWHQRQTSCLDLARLASIRAKVSIPLVLHGSSGVTDDNIAQGIAMGLCKVNVATQLNKAFTRDVREALASNSDLVDPRKYLGAGRAAQIDAVRERIRFFGASGKAALVRGQL